MKGTSWTLAVAVATFGYVDVAAAQTAVPTAPPSSSFFAAPPPESTAAPTAMPAIRSCPHAIVKGGRIVRAVGMPTSTGCDWSATIRFAAGNATLTFVSTSKIAVREIDLGSDAAGHFGGGLIAMRPNGDSEFVHARGVVNEISVAFDVTP